MKKVFLVVTVLFLSFVGCFGSMASIYAMEVDDFVAENMETNGVQPRMMCLGCSSMMQMHEICIPGTRRYSGTREHSYGLLWSETCTITSYEAMAAYYCDVCGNTIIWEDSTQSDGYARHHCLEVHSSCGRGNNVFCPFGG